MLGQVAPVDARAAPVPATKLALYRAVVEQHGRLDAVVANAGVGDSSPIGSITEKQFDFIFGVDAKGVLFTVQAALPHLAAGGTIVATGSTASIQALPGLSLYGGSKAAIRQFVRAWIQEVKGTGIRIDVLNPGAVDTPSLRIALEGSAGAEQVDAKVKEMGDGNPVGASRTLASSAGQQYFLAATPRVSSPASSSSAMVAWPRPDELLTLELMAQDTVAWLEAIVRRPAHLVGYSAGAMVALRVAVARPDLVDKLVLISGAFSRDGMLITPTKRRRAIGRCLDSIDDCGARAAWQRGRPSRSASARSHSADRRLARPCTSSSAAEDIRSHAPRACVPRS